MTKYDSQSSRTAAIEADAAIEQFYRPAASSKARLPRPPIEAPPDSLRAWPEMSEDETEERQQDAFLRARRRVPVRRGFFPKSRNGRILFVSAAILAVVLLTALAVAVRNFLREDSRLRINSASNIQIMGNSQVTRPELLSVFGSDIGRNIFFVPLAERRAELEELPWVGQATVMRLLPNQLRVSIVERVPVAFLRKGNTIGLVDGNGVLLSLPPAMMAVKHYSFPVVTGIKANDPLPLRAARMHFYQQFIADLDSGGSKLSEQLSEVDISDPEDIRALLPAQGSDILVHFGESDFLTRYERYRQHLDEWRRLYPHLASVDLRYDDQVVLEMAKGTTVTQGQDGNASGAEQSGAGSKATAVQVPLSASPKPGRSAKRGEVVRAHDAGHAWNHKQTHQNQTHHQNRKVSPDRRHKLAGSQG